jgi:rhamnopyranosyl-N-acetylglucosaminyl-diphospho-decaprenol beta-1,3/1,4-galactofuranosyltransferase
MISSTNAAVVVTFNRKELLSECLDALLRQSQQLNAIFIVNNASSDGTKFYLQEHGYLDNPVIRYIELTHNMGGAGGFHVGMDAAHKAGFDWVWVMDDDTEPLLDALEKMETWKRYPRVVAIANRKIDRQGNQTSDGLRLFSKSKTGCKPYTMVRFSSFVGLLIRSTAMEAIGLPKSEFFIHNDDTEYCVRLRSIGDIAFAFDSAVAHKEIAREKSGKKVFSHIFYQEDIERFSFNYFGHRNYTWIQQTYVTNLLVRYMRIVRRFALFTLAILAFDRDYRWLRIKILAKANIDGIRGHFDNGFPQRLREQLKIGKSTAS